MKKKKIKIENKKRNLSFSSILKKDIPLLYKFMCWYSVIDGLKTNKEVNAKFPPQLATDVIKLFQKKISINIYFIVNYSINEISEKLPLLADTLVYYVSDCSKFIDLMRHLRNSIAHDLLYYRQKKFYIKDYNSKQRLTAYGVIEEKKMYELINTIFDKTKI